MRNINDDIATVQEAYAKEAKFDGKHVTVPDDFFRRLQAKLNPPGPTIFDHLKEAIASNDRVAAFKEAIPAMTDDNLRSVVRQGVGSGEQCQKLSYAKAEIGRRRGYPVA